jgi:hypothetical protein
MQPTIAPKAKIPKTTPLPLAKRSSSAIDDHKKGKIQHNCLGLPSTKSCSLSLQMKKDATENANYKSSDENPVKVQHRKSNKNSASLTTDTFREDDIIPRGLLFLESQGLQEYYSRFGISQILRLPIDKCKEYFKTQNFKIFKCKKVKTIQGKQQKDQDELFMNTLFEEPYNIYLIITDKTVFTTVDVKKEDNKRKIMYIDS